MPCPAVAFTHCVTSRSQHTIAKHPLDNMSLNCIIAHNSISRTMEKQENRFVKLHSKSDMGKL